MLVLRLIVSKAFGAFLYDEPARPARGIRQDRIEVGDSAVANPLLAAIDLVSDYLAALHDAVGCGLERAQIAAGVRFRGPVRKQNSLLRDAAQPELLLLQSRADCNRIAS